MATAFQDVLTKLSAQKAALDGQMKAVRCLEATRETLADLGFDAAVSAKEGRLRLEVRLEAVRALPAPDPDLPVAEDPGPPPPPAPAPSVPLVKDAPPEPNPPEPCKQAAPSAPEYVTGPFSDDEKAIVEEMARAGAEASEIATRLGRNTPPVALQMRRALAQAKPAPSQAAPPEAKPVSEKHIDKHLDKLGYGDGWTAARDLQLAEIIVRGDGIATAGAVLRVRSDKAKERWAALNTKRGDIDHQTCLMTVLRRRAGA